MLWALNVCLFLFFVFFFRVGVILRIKYKNVWEITVKLFVIEPQPTRNSFGTVKPT